MMTSKQSTRISIQSSPVVKRQSKTREAIFDTLRSFQRKTEITRAASQDKENSPAVHRNGKDHGRSRSFLPASLYRKQPLKEAHNVNRLNGDQPRMTASWTMDQVSDIVCSAVEQDYIAADRPATPMCDSRKNERTNVNTLALNSLYSQVILPSCFASRRPRSSAGSSAIGMENISESIDSCPQSPARSLLPPKRSHRRRSVQIGALQTPSLTRSSTESNLDQLSSVPSLMVSTDSSQTIYVRDAGAFEIVTSARSPLSKLQAAQGHDRRSFGIPKGKAENENGHSKREASNQSIESRKDASSRHSKRRAIYFTGSNSSLSSKAEEQGDNDSMIVDLVNSFASSAISSRGRSERPTIQPPPPYYEQGHRHTRMILK